MLLKQHIIEIRTLNNLVLILDWVAWGLGYTKEGMVQSHGIAEEQSELRYNDREQGFWSAFGEKDLT